MQSSHLPSSNHLPGGLWLSLNESLAQKANLYVCTICLQTHKHTHPLHISILMAGVLISLYLDPLLRGPCLMKQRPLAYEIPWRGLKNQFYREFLGATREILVRPKPRVVSWGVWSDTDLTASGYPGFGKRTIRWELFQGDKPSPVLSDKCVCLCASKEVRPTLGIAKEQASK